MLNKSNAFKFRQANSANQVEEAPKANPNADSRNEEIEAQRVAFMKVNPDFDMEKIPDNDPETFQMLAEGKTQGVFQLESAGITSVCVNMKPTSIEDITAIVALYRPGPMDSIPHYIKCKNNPDSIPSTKGVL